MSERLNEYMRCRKSGGHNWRYNYDVKTSSNQAYLLGHYQGLLDELIDSIGINIALDLVCSINDIAHKINKLRDEIDITKRTAP